MTEPAFERIIQDLDLNPSQYEALERDVQLVLQEMQGDETLERFRQEYEKLFRALKRSQEIEKRLIKRCRELNKDIQTNAKNVQDVLKMAQEDSETIKTLKSDVEKAWQMVDAAKEKEERSKQTIHNLKQEVGQLGKIVEQGAGITVNQENTINQLIQSREELQKEREVQIATLGQIKHENQDLLLRVANIEKEIENLDIEKKNLKDSILQHKNDAEREERRKKRLEAELDQAKKKRLEAEQELVDRDRREEDAGLELEHKRKELEEMHEYIQELEMSIKETWESMQQVDTEINNLTEVNKNLEKERRVQTQQYEEYEHKILEVRQSVQQIIREVIKQKKSNKQMQELIEDANMQKELSKQNIHNLGKSIESAKRQAEEDRKQLTALEEERKKLEENVKDVEEVTKNKQENYNNKIRREDELNREIQKKKEDATKLAQDIWQLEKVKEKFGIEASQANAKYFQCLEEVKLKNNLIAELQKKNLEAEARLKQQQNLCEAVRSDRNLYSKNLIESQDKIAELRRNFKIFHHQIEQHKEEIEGKTVELKDCQVKVGKLARDNEGLKHSKEKVQKTISELESKKKNLLTEAEKLKEIILNADAEREEQKKLYEKVINMRDLLGTQLIRKNDELALLYEKIKIQQNALANGEVMYQERIGDIRLLKFKIADLNRELAIINKQAELIEELKQDVFTYKQELADERTKVKALSEELENSLSVTRYKTLPGRDPPKDELLNKVQGMQHHLIRKTEQVVELDVQLQEKNKLVYEITDVLDKQPKIEVARQLSYYQQKLKETTRQMKAIASELNMHHSQINECKYQIEKETRELQEYKRKYYERRRAERENA